MAERKLERRPILDPAVADLLQGMEKKQAEAQMPRKQREKLARERAKIQSRREQRATYDLPPALRERIRAMAEAERLPASQLVTLALARFIQAFDAGEINLAPFKQPSASPRYDWNLVFGEEMIPAAPRKKSARKHTPA